MMRFPLMVVKLGLRSTAAPRMPRFLSRSILCRTITTGGKDDWMLQAELDALAATKSKVNSQGSPNDVMMGKLTVELQGERISNAVKLEDKLRQLIEKANAARARATDAIGRKVFTAVRKKCLETRQELIMQKEAAGMVGGAAAAEVIERSFAIPGPV